MSRARFAAAAALLALAAARPARAQRVDLPMIGVQLSYDHWRKDPTAIQVSGGPGIGLRYEGEGLAAITNGIVRAYSSFDAFYAGAPSGGHTILTDFTLAMSAVAPLRSGVTPYLGGGLGFVMGKGAGGVSPIVAAGVQLARRSGEKVPYVDVTWYTRNSRRVVFSVGMFL